MAIDYVIDYQCYPKQGLGTDGIIARLKARERAAAVIRLFRERGDDRPPAQMGFEFTRSSRAGAEETRTVVVQELLDRAAELKPYAAYCAGCPANRSGEPFGCVGYVGYPISTAAELWLLKRLPTPEEPLIWLLLRQGTQELGYDGSAVAALRGAGQPYFEQSDQFMRGLGEFAITTNQLFEMIFLLGDIQPNHAGVLLLFFHAVPRDIEADEMMNISPAPEDAHTRFPFLLAAEGGDDRTISELKQLLHALYLAWRLDVPLLLDV